MLPQISVERGGEADVARRRSGLVSAAGKVELRRTALRSYSWKQKMQREVPSSR